MKSTIEPGSEPAPATHPGRKKRVWIIATSVVMILVIAVLLAPSLLVRTPLRQKILPLALGPYPGKYNIQKADLNWWEPVNLYGLKLDDMQGRPMIEVDRVETEKNLITLSTNQQDVGTLNLYEPRIHLHIDREGTNLTRVWNAYLRNLDRVRSAASAAEFTVKLTRGSIIESGTLPLGLDVHDVDGSVHVRNSQISGRLEARLAGGEIRVSPIISLTGDEVRVTQAEATSLEGIELRADQVSNWLFLVAPVLSGSTRVEGRISGTVDSADISLNEPTQSLVEGKLHIEAGRLDAGPLSEAVLDVARRLFALLEKPEAGRLPPEEQFSVELPPQTLSFSVKDGRVSHDALKITAGGLDLQTSGHVGLNRSVDLWLTTTIPRAWVDETQWLEELANEELKFHIQGSLTEPQLDDAAIVDLIERLGTKVVIEGVADAIEGPLLELLGF